jgi:hypothetical protein
MIATPIIELFWYEATFHAAARASYRSAANRQVFPEVETMAVKLVVGAREESEVE